DHAAGGQRRPDLAAAAHRADPAGAAAGPPAGHGAGTPAGHAAGTPAETPAETPARRPAFGCGRRALPGHEARLRLPGPGAGRLPRCGLLAANRLRVGTD